MRAAFYLLVCVIITGCASAPEQTEAPAKKQILNYEKADADYVELAEKVLRREATKEDFDRIIKLFPLTSFYVPDDKIEVQIKQASAKFMQENQWFPCLRVNRELINRNFTSLTGHYGMAICSQEARDNEGAAFHNWVLDNYIEAIWRTGNGQSPDSAFYINSAQDLIAFVQLHQLQITSQELLYQNELPIQHVRVQNPENRREYDWYFDMTAQFRRAYINRLEAEPQ